jgi:hypothetical protein
VFINEKFCKDLELAKAEDLFFSGLQNPGDTDNLVGSNVTIVSVDQIPGLNTLSISLTHIDFAPYGENLPHTHPRGTEIDSREMYSISWFYHIQPREPPFHQSF